MKNLAYILLLLLLASPVFAQTWDNDARFIPSFTDCLPTTSGGVASNLFDSDLSTETQIQTTGTLECLFDEDTVIRSYMITGDNNPDRSALNWSFEYWNGSAWVVLDAVTNEPGWSVFENRSYSIASPVSASLYRLVVTDVQGSTPRWDVPELRFSEYNVSLDYTKRYSSAGSSVEFTIEAGGFVLVGQWNGELELCSNDSTTLKCRILPPYDSYTLAQFHTDYTTPTDITITTLSNDPFRFDGINVIETIGTASSSSGGNTTITHEHIYYTYDPAGEEANALAQQEANIKDYFTYDEGGEYVQDVAVTYEVRAGDLLIALPLFGLILIQLVNFVVKLWTP
jgi:hypothetical protein